MVVGTVKVAVAVPMYTVRGSWALVTHPRSTLNQAWQQAQAGWDFVYQAGSMVIALGTHGQDFLGRVIAGNPEALQVGMQFCERPSN